MLVKPIKTRRVLPETLNIYQLLDESLTGLSEDCVIALSSKVVAVCENRVVPIGSVDKEDLIRREADYYLPIEVGKYGYHFTITHNTMISAAGIDESNAGGNYILWPANPQETANNVRAYLANKFSLKRVGVIIIDSSCMMLRYGTLGIVIGHSGFRAINDYRGTPDLFGRPFLISQASVGGGLAAAANLVMGEGTEQTPIVLLEDLPFVHFQDRDPNLEELKGFYLGTKDEDLFAPFLNRVEWLKGGRKPTTPE